MNMNTLTCAVTTSIWKKDGKVCKVHSTWKKGSTNITFQFTGWNPFPCFSMMSTYPVVAKWLQDNGWVDTGKRIYANYHDNP